MTPVERTSNVDSPRCPTDDERAENERDRSQGFSRSILRFRFATIARFLTRHELSDAAFRRDHRASSGNRQRLVRIGRSRRSRRRRRRRFVRPVERRLRRRRWRRWIDLGHHALIACFRRRGKRTLRHQTFEGHFGIHPIDVRRGLVFVRDAFRFGTGLSSIGSAEGKKKERREWSRETSGVYPP